MPVQRFSAAMKGPVRISWPVMAPMKPPSTDGTSGIGMHGHGESADALPGAADSVPVGARRGHLQVVVGELRVEVLLAPRETARAARERGRQGDHCKGRGHCRDFQDSHSIPPRAGDAVGVPDRLHHCNSRRPRMRHRPRRREGAARGPVQNGATLRSMRRKCEAAPALTKRCQIS